MKIIQLIVIAQSFLLLSSCNTIQSNTAMKEHHLYQENESLDDVLFVNPTAVENLQALQSLEKFGSEERSEQLPLGYVGFLPHESRPIANQLLNESIKRLIVLIKSEQKITHRMILDEFEKGLNSYNDLVSDTEDRERICLYYEDMMDFIGLESTHELLNNWLYNFPHTQPEH